MLFENNLAFMHFETITVSDEVIILPEISAVTWPRGALAHAMNLDQSLLLDFSNASSSL